MTYKLLFLLFLFVLLLGCGAGPYDMPAIYDPWVPSDEQEARREIVQMDRERADFVLTHFRAGVDDPLHYDVVINSERASFNAAVEVILALRKSKAQRSSSA